MFELFSVFKPFKHDKHFKPFKYFKHFKPFKYYKHFKPFKHFKHSDRTLWSTPQTHQNTCSSLQE